MALNINGTTGISGVDASVSAPAVTGTDSNTGISFPSADTIKFSTGGVERMSITNSGVSGTGILTTGGKVLQIKSENFTSQFAYNSSSGTSFVATNITVDITPTSASSKIYVRADFNIWKSGSSAQVNSTIYRDSTNLGGSFYGFGEYAVNAAYAVQWNMAYNDSPNTTSQITYTVRAKLSSGSGPAYFHSQTIGTLTVIEIAQ